MLISTEMSWVQPQWPGEHVCVVLPRHDASVTEIRALRATGIVFEFLDPPNGLTILCEVLDRTHRSMRFNPDSLLFSTKHIAADDLAMMAQRAAYDPWLIDYAIDEETGDLAQLLLGWKVTSNALFLHFFRNLENVQDLAPVPVMEALKQHMGKPEDESGVAE